MDSCERRRRGFCIECGGRIVLARENEYYTATEPCCSSCGLVYSEDEYFWHYNIMEIARFSGAGGKSREKRTSTWRTAVRHEAYL